MNTPILLSGILFSSCAAHSLGGCETRLSPAFSKGLIKDCGLRNETAARESQNQICAPVLFQRMLDFAIAGPIVGVLVVVDVALHIYMDIKKIQGSGLSAMKEPDAAVPKSAMVAIASSTLLAFALVLLIPTAWLTSQGPILVQSVFPIADSPVLLWSGGLVILGGGVILHGWSRKVRQLHASSWTMTETHKLVMNGPYSWIRHPSYLSYVLSFIGLVLMMPSVLTVILLVGIPGYYTAAMREEQLLISHFGNDYRNYMMKTGRFIPKLRKHD